MNKRLVYDVGMCDSTDTARYLALGHDVVAIEAIPWLCDMARERFAKEIQAGRLVILNVAIASEREPTILWVNSAKDGWSSLYRHLGTRGGGGHPIVVQGERFEAILVEHGIPWYLKVDIEGADHLCLEALFELDTKPEFISVEAAETAWFWMLHGLGYRRFALVDQAPLNANNDRPDLPESSGPLPDEIEEEEWVDIETACQQFSVGKSWYDIYAAW